jgi:hypothetical protein
MILGVICLMLVGIGLAIGAAIVGSAALLVTFGFISSSAFVVFWSKRWSAGLRMLHYQVCVAAAIPGGIFLLWLACRVFHLWWPLREKLLLGAAAGAAGGLLFAITLDFIARFAVRRMGSLAQAASSQL